MVSVGTVISLIAGGAVIAGGIAVFSNLDRIRDAFTRGIEESVTKPFSDYLDSLFKGNGATTQSGQSSIAGQTVSSVNQSTIFIPADTTILDSGVVKSSTPPLLTLSPEEKQSATTIQKRNVNLSELALGQEGFYYFNVAGSKFDTQQFLSGSEAAKLSTALQSTLFKTGGLENIKFLGKSPLQEAGFRLFGQSQGYL